ncbi:VOC family protein [Streptomonospora wellingtoniae]|uniref:VOC family protein n=1 Tax=Streptomonospora wellingtoniae TaxID=3075544 RepID=A0ABU2KRY4_9ACTN|nr:VOC family protein [Streptomonospora sp. DSM 45055]MDT0301927.1 VOC family protein [Streptomonospora sp. DSM 45055]
MIGRLSTVVLDCPDPRALAAFYSEVLGMPITRAEGDWVDIGDRDGTQVSFQLAPDHVPPRWPDPAYPQQFHLDVDVDDIAAAEERVLALGAAKVREDGTFRVYTDPAGHPFCLVLAPSQPAG